MVYAFHLALEQGFGYLKQQAMSEVDVALDVIFVYVVTPLHNATTLLVPSRIERRACSSIGMIVSFMTVAICTDFFLKTTYHIWLVCVEELVHIRC